MRNRIAGYSPATETRRPPSGAAPRAQGPPTAGHEHFSRTMQSLGTKIAEHPGVSLGVALTIGVFLGWLIKRR